MPESFIEFLTAYGEANPPAMVYRDGEDVRQWRKQLLAKVRDLMEPVPDRVEPAANVVQSWEEPDHTRHLLHIPVNTFSTLPAYLLVPFDLTPGERRAGVLIFHGHAKYGIDSVCGVRNDKPEQGNLRAYALHAVRSGFVVLAPGWWGWTGRDGHVGQWPNRDKCNVIQIAAGMYGLSVLGLHMQDAAAAFDALAARPEVDGTRIGCAGNSYGGRTTMWFAALDERVKACVPSGCMNTFRERSQKLGSCGIQYPYGLLRWCDMPEVFSLIAPRPMQLQAGTDDTLITPADRDHIERTVRQAYRAHGAEDHLDYVLNTGGHWLVWGAAETFLRKHLRAD